MIRRTNRISYLLPVLAAAVVFVQARVLGHRVRADVQQDGVPEEKRGRGGRRERGCSRTSDDRLMFDFFGGREAVRSVAPPPPPLVIPEEAGGLVRVEHAELPRAAKSTWPPPPPAFAAACGAAALPVLPVPWRGLCPLPSFVYAQVVMKTPTRGETIHDQGLEFCYQQMKFGQMQGMAET